LGKYYKIKNVTVNKSSPQVCLMAWFALGNLIHDILKRQCTTYMQRQCAHMQSMNVT